MQLLPKLRRVGTLAPVDGAYMRLLQTDDPILTFMRIVFVHPLLLRINFGNNEQTILQPVWIQFFILRHLRLILLQLRSGNFSGFDRVKFNKYLESYTTKLEKKMISLDRAILEAKTAPANTYIVVFFEGGNICYVGKTFRLLSYIEEKSKKYNADSVFFYTADDDYVDDLIIAIMIFYDLSLSNVRLSKSNRKYATVQQACYAYRYADSISKKQVLSAIRDNRLRLYEIDAEKRLIDKTELEQVIRSGMSQFTTFSKNQNK